MEQVLIIDDSLVQARMLQDIVGVDYDVALCQEGTRGLEEARRLQPSLILLDVVMPGMDGFEVLRQLKRNADTEAIPVIMITSLTDVDNEERGLMEGAVDYITKPFKPNIVRARVHTHTQLYGYRKAVESLARLDGLTGVANRRSYEERSAEMWRTAMRRRAPLSIGLLDIDFFKQYNDTYGHPSGDTALRAVAQAVSARLRRAGDFVARYGGEEFVFLLPDTAGGPGRELADGIRRDIEALGIPHQASAVSRALTVSVGGITVVPPLKGDYPSYFDRVDGLLYRAKREGRNRVVWEDEETDQE